MNLTFRKPTTEEVHTLCEFASEIYYETFIDGNSERVMQDYLDEAFASEKLTQELNNPDSTFLFLYADGVLAGYLKVNRAPSQTDINDPDMMELERIYAAKEFHGKGIGQALMDKAIGIAEEEGFAAVWLGVWEKNMRARAFYEKNGFTAFGTHVFVMGDEAQTDLVMKKELKQNG
ncbi:MAG: GNAT family N-acetyltransferase [Anaerofustis sp.]